MANRAIAQSLIPDSVVYQYPVSTFGSSTWSDDVGTADMSVNGMTSSTFANGDDSVEGDGVDDHGLATGPETLPENQTLGVAMTIQYQNADVPGFEYFGGVSDADAGNGRWGVRGDNNGPDGCIAFFAQDNASNQIQVYTDNAYGDGSPRAVVINKHGDTAADIDIFVDDMTTPVSVSVASDSGFDHTNYANTRDFGFYTRNNDGTIQSEIPFHAGIWEFSTEAYTEAEREDFVSRRPEV